MGKQASAPGSSLMTIFHGEKFVVVDREGNIRGYYDADEEGIRDLLREVESLARAR
jgi:protein SCO1/2